MHDTTISKLLHSTPETPASGDSPKYFIISNCCLNIDYPNYWINSEIKNSNKLKKNADPYSRGKDTKLHDQVNDANNLTRSNIYNTGNSVIKHITLSLHKKMKFSIKDFFSKCDQIRSFLRIWSHVLKKCLMENFIFYAVCSVYRKKQYYFWLFAFWSKIRSCWLHQTIVTFHFVITDTTCNVCHTWYWLLITLCNNWQPLQ